MEDAMMFIFGKSKNANMNSEVFDIEVFSEVMKQEIYLHPDQNEITSFGIEESADANPKLIFLIRNENAETAGEEEMSVIVKTADWKELNLKRNEVRIINIARQVVSFATVMREFNPQAMVFFGIEPSDAGLFIELHYNKLIRFRNCNLIFSSSIAELLKNDLLKKKFFDALKQLNRTNQN